MIYIWHLLYALLLMPFVIAADFGLSIQANLWLNFHRTDNELFRYNIQDIKHKVLIVLTALSMAALLVDYNSQTLLILSMFCPMALTLRTIHKVFKA